MPSHPRAKLLPDGTCTRCNLIHPKCAAHNNRGLPCGRPHINGGYVCASHGGRTGIAKRKAAERIAQAEADAAKIRACKTLGVRFDGLNISPTEALLEEVTWTYVHVQWLRTKVQELEDRASQDTVIDSDDGDPVTIERPGGHALIWGQVEFKSKTGGDDWGKTTVDRAGPNAWYELYSRERDRLIKVCSEAIRAGIEERRVQLAEQQGALVAEAIRRILDDLNLSPEQLSQVASIVPRHLRAIAGGMAS
jgi:hypothetical protein